MTDLKTILIVDDDSDVLDQVEMMLADSGYNLLFAQSQAEGEKALMDHRPDLAIIDLMMEEVDSGFTLCHSIKQIYPETPVVLMTAVTAATGLSFGANRGDERSWLEADTMLNKPVRPEILRNEVKRLLAR